MTGLGVSFLARQHRLAQREEYPNTATNSQAKQQTTRTLPDNINYWILGLPTRTASINKDLSEIWCFATRTDSEWHLLRTDTEVFTPSDSRWRIGVQSGGDRKFPYTMERIGVLDQVEGIRTAGLDECRGHQWTPSNWRVPFTILRASGTTTGGQTIRL